MEDILDKLLSKANEDETYLDFICTSEREFGLDCLGDIKTIDELNEYIEFLDNLWGK